MPLLHESLYTESAEDAAAALSALYPDFTFQEPARGERFHFRQLVIGDERGALARMDFAGNLKATAELENQFVVVQPLAGRLSSAFGAEWVELTPTQPGLTRPGGVRTVMDHASLLTANFSESSLKEALCAFHGVDRVALSYPRMIPVSAAKAQMWVESVDYVRRTVLTPGVAANEGIRRSAFQTLGLVAIDAFGVEVDMATPPPLGAGPASVRRAKTFMDENASGNITINEIATAAHLSVRGLQLAFRRSLGTTPMEYLRHARLTYAHAELVASDPSVTTVGAVGLRWGFAHQGRFAATYRAVYGCSPGETLKN